MNPDDLFRRYEELQHYVGWTEKDAHQIQTVAGLLEPCLSALVDDFYAEIDRHPEARKVITGGDPQIARLKGTLIRWLQELLRGPYDADYVARRWQVGWRHVEIGLDQVYTNVALSRLRTGLLRALEASLPNAQEQLIATRYSLHTLLDLDLAIIEDAYQAEYTARRQRSERLAAIGQVAGGIAHEVRNPLNVVKTSVYYLLNARNPTSTKTTEHLQRIERHVAVADRVITALSNFARLPVPNLQSLSLGECVREVLELNPLPENIDVAVDCDGSLPRVFADADQLRIILGNLVRNACEAMLMGGRLSLTGRNCGGAVELHVTDTGTGIAKEIISQIMEPLYTTKARGLGLGLALARAIVEKNQGSIRVTSEPGRGTTFIVRLAAAV